MPKRGRERPARITQRRDKHVHAHRLVPDTHALLTEVDLELMTRRRLEPHRRARFRRQLLPIARHRPLDRPQAHRHAQLARQILTNDIRIASVAEEALTKPGFVASQFPARGPALIRLPSTSAEVPLHRRARAAKLSRQTLASPTQLSQPQHRRHLVRLEHRFSPRNHRGDPLITRAHLSLPPLRGGQISLATGDQNCMSPDIGHIGFSRVPHRSPASASHDVSPVDGIVLHFAVGPVPSDIQLSLVTSTGGYASPVQTKNEKSVCTLLVQTGCSKPVCTMSMSLQLSIRTMFADLVQQVDTAPLAGSVYTRQRDGIEYIYAKLPAGRARVDRFIGKSGDPAAEAQAASLRRGGELARSRREIISILKGHRLASPDRALGAALDAIAFAGLFKQGAVLVGTGAYMMFEPLVGSRLPAPTLMTGDLDLATAQLALTADPPERMEDILRRADATYEGIPQLRSE